MQFSVLYIHHVGAFSGSARSLLEMIKAFPEGIVKPHLITPNGNLVDFLLKENVPTITTTGITQFDNTEHSHYRGFRWVLLFRELYYLGFTFQALLMARKQWPDIEVVHVNEITALVPVVLAKLIFRKPVFVHVRSMQRGKRGLRLSLVKFVLTHFSDGLIAIDETVKRSLPTSLAVHIVHNSLSMRQSTSGKKLEFRRGEAGSPMKIAIVGTLLKVKGVYDFVEAARICSERKLKVDFVLVGQEVRELKGIKGALLKRFGFAHDVSAEILAMISQNGLNDNVRLIGFTPDIAEIYENIDIICFPSHLNAVGRPVFEAAFYKVPSIVAIEDPLEDTVIDGQTGICIPAKSPAALADAIEYFYSNPAEIQRMGQLAFDLASREFNATRNAERVLSLYSQAKAKQSCQ